MALIDVYAAKLRPLPVDENPGSITAEPPPPRAFHTQPQNIILHQRQACHSSQFLSGSTFLLSSSLCSNFGLSSFTTINLVTSAILPQSLPHSM
ncbi:hypothetical protein DID88_008796 [Monilinia fructigena]|uniref:Uncharacterized protein n=1 Tax=Monilinia fructigena TaxID=38457 RepID=A0A395J6G5_9HELO|nr:hypothetical protein DID88_008796 [Monilinia fructigena]